MTEDLERLAMAEWPSSAEAQVTSIIISVDRAEVGLALSDGYEYWMYFTRDSDGDWSEAVSGNAPVERWQDPRMYDAWNKVEEG